MDGVNEVGEVKVSRLQMEGEGEDKTPPEHKVDEQRGRKSLDAAPSVWWSEVEASQFDTLLCGFSVQSVSGLVCLLLR